MSLRRDALAAASEMVLAIERLGSVEPDTVSTVGRLAVEPGAVNVIPGRVSFTLDARGPLDAVREHMVDAILAECRAIARRRKVTLAVEPFFDSPACPCHSGIQAGLSAALSRLQLPVRALPSGAGHDAMAMAALCPVGMLFVRCEGGVSHNPAENMTAADADLAIRTLIDFTRNYSPA
jgi:allantoate deiminase